MCSEAKAYDFVIRNPFKHFSLSLETNIDSKSSNKKSANNGILFSYCMVKQGIIFTKSNIVI